MGKKILFAVGGTGGHLFPAQALAHELKAEGHDVLFAGGRLGSNPLFKKGEFPFEEIRGESPYSGSKIKAFFELCCGVYQSVSLLKMLSPDLVIGFGSFYSFPILFASNFLRLPYVLVESNAIPGKVNRLFARRAAFTALQYGEAANFLKGEVRIATMPLLAKKSPLEQSEARKYYRLDPDLFTLLVFGGSAGAEAFNRVAELVDDKTQVLHFCGKGVDRAALEKQYRERGIHVRVKPFEERMEIAFAAADLVLCRSGSGTLNELVTHEIPSILVPWPGAAENHQQHNAKVLESRGGAMVLEQQAIDTLPGAIGRAKERLVQMRQSLKREKESSPPLLKDWITKQLDICKNTTT